MAELSAVGWYFAAASSTYSIITTQLIPLKLNHECFMSSACERVVAVWPTDPHVFNTLDWLEAVTLITNLCSVIYSNRLSQAFPCLHARLDLYPADGERSHEAHRFKGEPRDAAQGDEKKDHANQVVGNDYYVTRGRWWKESSAQREDQQEEFKRDKAPQKKTGVKGGRSVR